LEIVEYGAKNGKRKESRCELCRRLCLPALLQLVVAADINRPQKKRKWHQKKVSGDRWVAQQSVPKKSKIELSEEEASLKLACELSFTEFVELLEARPCRICETPQYVSS
jgi:hypothetical protein